VKTRGVKTRSVTIAKCDDREAVGRIRVDKPVRSRARSGHASRSGTSTTTSARATLSRTTRFGRSLRSLPTMLASSSFALATTPPGPASDRPAQHRTLIPPQPRRPPYGRPTPSRVLLGREAASEARAAVSTYKQFPQSAYLFKYVIAVSSVILTEPTEPTEPASRWLTSVERPPLRRGR